MKNKAPLKNAILFLTVLCIIYQSRLDTASAAGQTQVSLQKKSRISSVKKQPFSKNQNKSALLKVKRPQRKTTPSFVPPTKSSLKSSSSTQQKARYQPDVLIVKFTNDAADNQRSTELKVLLQNKFSVESVEPVFKALHERMKKTSKSEQELFEEVRHRFPKRAAKITQAALSESPGLSRIYALKIKPVKKGANIIIEEAIALLKKSGDIEYVERNQIFASNRINFNGGGGGGTGSNLPNDTYVDPDQNNTWSVGSWGQAYEDIWGLKKINMESAWALTHGDQNVIVAVSDTGIDYDHPDIQGNLWSNAGEIPSDSVDNDGNGYIDDYLGWDFNTCAQFDDATGACLTPKNADNDPLDGNGHGTHVAGIIGAMTSNGTGIAGVNYYVTLMPIKGLNDTQGKGTTLDLANTITYAADEGADIINMSWGGRTYYLSETLRTALDYAYNLGVTLVAAAGNDGWDVSSYYPANYPNLITVASTDSNDTRVSTSNYGSKIDVAAPGADILSLRADGTGNAENIVGSYYYRKSGTSMAAAYTSGLAALLLAQFPHFNSEQIKAAIAQGADDIDISGKDIYTGSGRINAYNSLQISDPLIAKISNPQEGDYLVANSTVEIRGTAMGGNFQSYTLEYGVNRNPSVWNVIAASTSSVIESNGLLAPWNTQGRAAGVYTLRLTVTPAIGQPISDIRVVNLGAQAGWPQSVSGNIDASLVAGDVDGDGKKEIIATASQYGGGGQLSVFKSDGTLLTAAGATFAEGFFPEEPALVDLDGDGKLDIMYVIWDSNTRTATLTAVRYDGYTISGFPYVLPGEVLSIPVVVADLDRNNRPEIIIRTEETNSPVYVYEYNPSGNPKIQLKWSKPTVSSYYETAPSAGDLDKDGYPEIVVTTQSKIYVFDRNGNSVSGWPQTVSGAKFERSATLGDITADKNLEVVVFNNQDGKACAFDSQGNRISDSWPVLHYHPGQIQETQVLADIDGDGKHELIGSRFILKINSNGTTTLTQWTRQENGLSTPVVADIDNDASHAPEILFSSFWYSDPSFLYAYRSDGSQITNSDLVNFPLELEGLNNGLRGSIVDDFDNDGKLELTAASLVDPYVLGKIYIWELGSYSRDSLNNSWNMPDHDPQHTNAAGKVVTDLYVPNDFSTIQKAIDAAVNGYIVHVAAGVYDGAIDFKGKKIKVIADQGPMVTTLQTAANPYTVSFISGEGRDSSLEGFTIINTYPSGNESTSIGVYCLNSSPTITSNIIKAQSGLSTSGTGVWVDNGYPLISGNTISDSSRYGVVITDRSAPRSLVTEIANNTISRNNYAGIKIISSGAGGRENIHYNVIAGNGCNGLWLTFGTEYTAKANPLIINNTIVETGTVCSGAGIDIANGSNPTVVNNIITSNSYYGIHITSGTSNYLSLGYNDLWNNKSGDYSGIGAGGEDIHADPKFSDSSYHLSSSSPCINVGFPFYLDPDGTIRDIGAFSYSSLGVTGIVQNASFEIDTGMDFYPGWNDDDALANNNIPDGWSDDYAVIDSAVFYQDSKSMKISVNNSRGFSVQDIPIEPNKTYRVSGYVKTDCEDSNCYGTILTECMDSNHVNIWDYSNCRLNTNPDDIQRLYGDNNWTKIEFDVDSDNSNAEFLRMICYNTPGPDAFHPKGTGVVWCDSFSVVEAGYQKQMNETPDDSGGGMLE